MKTYYAHGKLLLTGEYLVLHGATALALPVKLGQSIKVEPAETSLIQWSARHPDGPWLSASFNPYSLDVVKATDPAKAAKLSQVLQAIRSLNPSAFEPGLSFETRLDFNPSWGLGSSSTLLSLLAQWSGVNPYELLKMTFGGSGYDIACATADTSIYYQLRQGEPLASPVVFQPPFADHLFFVYQGQKQTSSTEVGQFNSHFDPSAHANDMATVDRVSLTLPQVTDLDDFRDLMTIHEIAIARCTGKTPVQMQYRDFKGTLKSLGAWGGDFLLAATGMSFEEVSAYFRNKGLTTLFKYQDLVL